MTVDVQNKTRGRVTIPTNLDVFPETIEVLKRWGADAIRDCDGTEFPEELTKVGAKIYSTYYTTRKDNVWAKANPDEVQQCYIMSGFYTATGDEVSIPLMDFSRPRIVWIPLRSCLRTPHSIIIRNGLATRFTLRREAVCLAHF